VNCPTCGHALEEAELGHVAVHDCPNCGGMWLGRDELRRAKDDADDWVRWIDFDVFTSAEASTQESERVCPICGQHMKVLVYPHSKVEVEVCASDHGVWLDKGEFDKLVEALEELTNELTARDYERAAVHELRQIVTGGHESRRSEVKDFMAVFRLLERRIGAEHPSVASAVNVLSQGGL
jgi:Zn-finger nucleic acid-binding protein